MPNSSIRQHLRRNISEPSLTSFTSVSRLHLRSPTMPTTFQTISKHVKGWPFYFNDKNNSRFASCLVDKEPSYKPKLVL